MKLFAFPDSDSDLGDVHLPVSGWCGASHHSFPIVLTRWDRKQGRRREDILSFVWDKRVQSLEVQVSIASTRGLLRC